jgi:magnesium chelatase family protein
MLYKTFSAAVYGIDANIIEVEVDVSGIKTNEDHFHTVGLPDAAVRESRDRVRSALRNCGYDIPPTHITVNLAPADIRKEGSGFDLPMALGILGAYGCSSESCRSTVVSAASAARCPSRSRPAARRYGA